MVIIQESGMKFGEYEDEQVFQLEKSSQYSQKLRMNGVKSCEFILRKDNKLYFVEAKKSCPRKITADSSKEKTEKYKEYIRDIKLKMRHSLMLYANILLERYETDNIPKPLREKNLSDMEIRLVLVVKDAEKEWLIPFQDVFRNALQDELKIWKIPGVIIINEATARKYHFIL